MSSSFHLYQLQKIDSQINAALSRINEITQQLKNNTTLSEAKKELDNQTELFNITKTELKIIEDEVELKKIKIQECESKLYSGSIQNPKELQDLQNEHNLLQKLIIELEEELLDKMILHEEAQKSLNVIKERYQKVETNVLTAQSLLVSERDNLNNQITKANQERNAQVNQIDAALIEQYEKLRNEKKGVAVTHLVDGACSECGKILTPAQRQATKSSGDIFYCPNCHRIIYGG